MSTYSAINNEIGPTDENMGIFSAKNLDTSIRMMLRDTMSPSTRQRDQRIKKVFKLLNFEEKINIQSYQLILKGILLVAKEELEGIRSIAEFEKMLECKLENVKIELSYFIEDLKNKIKEA